MKLIDKFNNWFDSLDEPYRFIMMLILLTPWFISTAFLSNIYVLIFSLSYVVILIGTRNVYRLKVAFKKLRG
jgi:hypothetical protein